MIYNDDVDIFCGQRAQSLVVRFLKGNIMNSVASQAISDQPLDHHSEGNEHPSYPSKPIDLVHLSRQTFGSKELENEVLGLFVSHSRQCLNRLKTAETNQEWRDILHTIKGSARAIGAWKTADLAEVFEQKSEQLTDAEKIAAVKDMSAEVESTISYIQGLI